MNEYGTGDAALSEQRISIDLEYALKAEQCALLLTSDLLDMAKHASPLVSELAQRELTAARSIELRLQRLRITIEHAESA